MTLAQNLCSVKILDLISCNPCIKPPDTVGLGNWIYVSVNEYVIATETDAYAKCRTRKSSLRQPVQLSGYLSQ